jgi:hypothetical protein
MTAQSETKITLLSGLAGIPSIAQIYGTINSDYGKVADDPLESRGIVGHSFR